MSETPEPTVETAFLVVKTLDGLWQISGDVNDVPVVRVRPTRLDVKIGCAEMAQVIVNQDIAALVADMIVASAGETPQTED